MRQSKAAAIREAELALQRLGLAGPSVHPAIPARPDLSGSSRSALPSGSSLSREDVENLSRQEIATVITDLANDDAYPDRIFEQYLKRAISDAQHIGLDLCDFEDPDRMLVAMMVLSEKKGLQTLTVDASGIRNLAPMLIECLRDVQTANPSLRNLWLSLEACNLTDEEIHHLHKLSPSLKVLDVSNNRLGKRGAKELGRLQRLEILDASNNQLKSDGVRELTPLTNLKTLDLSSNFVGTDGAKKLTSLRRLSGLGLSGNNLDDRIVDSLKEMRSLTALDVSGNGISNRYLSVLQNLRGLQALTY